MRSSRGSDTSGSRDLGKIGQVDLLGVPVSLVTIGRVVTELERWVETEARRYVCVTGVHGVAESVHSAVVMAAHKGAGLVVPDGMPLVWAGRFAGSSTIGHVRGQDLMGAVLECAQRRGWKNYFYGGGPGLSDALCKNLLGRYPELEVCGSASPPFRQLSGEELIADAGRINEAGPTIVWVGLSTPKQEIWMCSARPYLNAPILIGVGAAFDMYAGTVRSAPAWLHNSGLEWSYRLAQEPRRLWRRYATSIPIFAVGVVSHPPRLVPMRLYGDG
jgi:N-acetylglucosaminyldiphosphoundecaprenol N-acetyl-beta-D-mannosaminyltransferase